MMKYTVLLLLIAGSAYSFNTMTDGPQRWNRTVDNPTIEWVWNSNATGFTMGAGEEADFIAFVESSIGLWEGVETSFIRFQYNGNVGNINSTTSYVEDKILVKVVDTPGCASWAAGCGGCASSSGDTCLGGIVEIQAEFLSGVQDVGWTGDYAGLVFTHEFGHAVGLHHSERKSIMSYINGSNTITSDDIVGISYLYPADGEDGGYNVFSCAGISDAGNPSDGGGPLSGTFLGLCFIFLSTISMVYFLGLVLGKIKSPIQNT